MTHATDTEATRSDERKVSDDLGIWMNVLGALTLIGGLITVIVLVAHTSSSCPDAAALSTFCIPVKRHDLIAGAAAVGAAAIVQASVLFALGALLIRQQRLMAALSR